MDKASVEKLEAMAMAVIKAIVENKTEAMFLEADGGYRFNSHWARDEIRDDLCRRHGLDPECHEIVLVEADRLSDPIVTKAGTALFRSVNNRGGLIISESAWGHGLRFHYESSANASVIVPSGNAICFVPDKGAKFLAVGIVVNDAAIQKEKPRRFLRDAKHLYPMHGGFGW